jgi:putative nucleotidyltransferase with HDIG domain
MSDRSSAVERTSEESGADDFYFLPISTLIPALTFAFDLKETYPKGHALRICAIGMQLGAKIGLPEGALANLYYALLFASDCTSLLLDGPNGFRYELATRFVQYIDLPHEVARLICRGHECWEETAPKEGPRDEQQFVLPFIINRAIALASGADQYVQAFAINALSHRSEISVDSDIVRALLLKAPIAVWDDLTSPELLSHVIALEPRHRNPPDKGLTIEGICLAFAQIADTRYPASFAHSVGVARIAVSIAKLMGLEPKNIKLLERAALVHDIGKVGIRSAVLEKSEALTFDEWSDIRRHPRCTKEILDKIPGFDEISAIAVAHHEKLDGSGYPCGLSASDLTLPARILTVADIYDALSSQRPYRGPLEREEALVLMSREAPGAIDQGCVDALAAVTSHDS